MTNASESKDMRNVSHLLKRLRSGDFTAQEQARFSLWELGGKIWNLDQVGEESVSDLLPALRDENQALQVSAIWALHRLAESNQLNDPEFRDQSLKALIDLLSDGDNDIRLSVVYALNWLKETRSVPALVECCLNDEDTLVAAKAANVLGSSGDKSAVPGLLEALKNTTDMLVRHSIILALGSLADARAGEPLADLLHKGDPLRGYAAVSLGEIGDKRATPVLLETLRSDPSQEVREWVVVGLACMKDAHAVPDLIQVLNTVGDNADFTYRSRYNAVHALREIGDESALPALIEAIDSAPEWQIRMASIDALEHVTNPEKAASLLTQLLLDHETDFVRGFAARALGFLARNAKDLTLRNRVVLRLIEGLSDTGTSYHYMPRVCDEAARSLQFIDTPEALAAIKNWKKGF